MGMLALEVHYYENGYPANEIAEESLKDKSRIVFAYNKEGKVSAWADSSLGDLKELETNSDTVDTEMKAFIQAIENKELKPYEDTIQTRRELAEIRQIELDMHKLMLEYGQRLNAHIPILELAEKLLNETPVKRKAVHKALEDVRQSKLRKE